jgi:hypothetical protein
VVHYDAMQFKLLKEHDRYMMTSDASASLKRVLDIADYPG